MSLSKHYRIELISLEYLNKKLYGTVNDTILQVETLSQEIKLFKYA